MQAVTKVNAEQASKRITQEPTRRKYGEGRSRWGSTSEQSCRSCRGIGDGMQTQGTRRNTGSPSGDRRGAVNWQLARTRPGRLGWGLRSTGQTGRTVLPPDKGRFRKEAFSNPRRAV